MCLANVFSRFVFRFAKVCVGEMIDSGSLCKVMCMSFDEVEERYKMLVLHGPSRTGKSRFARSLFGLGRTLVVDVQHAEHPDLRGYRRHEHLAVLLDEVASPQFIVSNKKLLQAHVDGGPWAET